MKFSLVTILLITFQHVNAGYVSTAQTRSILEYGNEKYWFELQKLSFTKTGQVQILATQFTPDSGTDAIGNDNVFVAKLAAANTSKIIIRIPFAVIDFGHPNKMWEEAFSGVYDITYIPSSEATIPECVKIVIQMGEERTITGTDSRRVCNTTKAFPTMPREAGKGTFVAFWSMFLPPNLTWCVGAEEVNIISQCSSAGNFSVDGTMKDLRFIAVRYW